MRFIPPLVLVIICYSLCVSQTAGERTEGTIVDTPAFVLPTEAVAAGIDGKILVNLTVSANGKPSDIRLFAGPMWPCKADPEDEVEKVRRAVKDYLLSAKFVPVTKNGKPISSDIQFVFLISDLFRDAQNARLIEENLRKGINPPLIEIPNLIQRAIDIPRMIGGNPMGSKFSEVQLLVDGNGSVISAGGLRTAPQMIGEYRQLACSSKFKPLKLNGKPVMMTGTITFETR